MRTPKIWILYDTKDNELPLAVGTLREIAESTGIPHATLKTCKSLKRRVAHRYMFAEYIEDFEERDDI